jgi:2-octaprenyl-6-methoxyphenol hydroxylase
LRDIAALTSSLEIAHQAREDVGGALALRRYAATQEPDIDIRVRGIDVLNRSMLSDALPVDMIRGLGFFAMSALGPLRRAALREGVLPDRRRSLRSAPRPTPNAIF